MLRPKAKSTAWSKLPPKTLLEIGRRIKAARLKAGQSVSDLAYRLDITRLDKVREWERGIRSPMLLDLFYIARALRCSTWDFLPED